MKNFNILPLETVYENYSAADKDEALSNFANRMEYVFLGNVSAYFKAVDAEDTTRVLAERVVSLIRSTDLTAGQCSDIFRALSDQEAVLGGKLWTTEAVKGTLDTMGYPSSIENICEVANNVDADRLNDCTDNEWKAIHEAIRQTLQEKKVIVTDIDWDTEDADNTDLPDLPKEVMITLGELRGFEDIAEYLSYKYEYAVNTYVISKE